MRNFRHRLRNSAPLTGLARAGRRKTQGFHAVPLAPLLPLEVTSIEVFRAALVSVVLTLAIGQNAGLLCKAWCHDATSTGCPHRDSTTSSSVRADDNCTTVAAGAVTFVREDGRRTAPAPDAGALSRFFGSDSPPHQLTRFAAMRQGGGCCSTNGLS